MKKFNELNYYELLEIPFNASSFRIRQAYENILDIYAEDSLLTYSLFTKNERREILTRIEKAFLTLIDNNKRADYDRKLGDNGRIPRDVLVAKETKGSNPVLELCSYRDRGTYLEQSRKKIEENVVRELVNSMVRAEFVSGNDLKKLREALGVELEEVVHETKISPVILVAIEQDEFTKLPPDIYLKSFLGSYAEVLQADRKKVVDGYFKNMHSQVH